MSLRIEAAEKGFFIVELRKTKSKKGEVNGMWLLGEDSVTLPIDGKLRMIGITENKNKFPKRALFGTRSTHTNDRVNWQVLNKGQKIIVGENPGITIESF